MSIEPIFEREYAAQSLRVPPGKDVRRDAPESMSTQEWIFTGW